MYITDEVPWQIVVLPPPIAPKLGGVQFTAKVIASETETALQAPIPLAVNVNVSVTQLSLYDSYITGVPKLNFPDFTPEVVHVELPALDTLLPLIEKGAIGWPGI